MSVIHELPPPFSTLDRHPAQPTRMGLAPSLGLPAKTKLKQPAAAEYFHEGHQEQGEVEEGDVLPPYSNNVRLVTICRRKREFNILYEKARKGQRSWEIVWMVLDGTALRMYKPTKEEKAEHERKWIGQQQQQQPSSSTSCSATPRESANSTPAQSIRSRSSPLALMRTPSSLYPTTTVESSTSAGSGTRSPSMGLKPLDDTPSQVLSRPIFTHSSSYNTSSNRLAPPPHHLMRAHTCHSTPALVRSSPLSRTISLSPSVASPATTSPPDFTHRAPVRQYTVRHAVCMKADAYIKREHVLRFILEDGKQFLVQLSGKPEMVSWLQVRHPLLPLTPIVHNLLSL
jgi:hypothetical protein